MRQIFSNAILLVAVAISAFGQTTDKNLSGDKGLEQHLIKLKRDWGKIYI